MNPVFVCGGECGQAGTVGQHLTLNGTAAFSTTTVRNGARSFQVNPVGAGFSDVLFVASGALQVMRAAVRFTTLPNIDCQIFGTNLSDGAWYQASDSTIRPGVRLGGVTTLGTSGVTVTTGIWYIVDVRTNESANPWLIDVTVNGTATNQLSAATGAASGSVVIGNSTALAVTQDVFYDDIIVSNTSADYPIGDGYVNHFVPTSDGTHTATTTTIVKGTIAAPTGGGNVAGATDVFNWVNGVPLLGGATDNTRLVNQATAGTTLYAECVFGPAPGVSTPTTGPRAVEVITADRQATTAVGDMHVKINDNGTEAVVLDRTAVAGVITDRFTTKQFATAPSTSAAWTATRFNALRARFGYSSDATPDQYWRGIMVEAEFAAAVAAAQLTPDLMHQAQMPALLAQ